MCKFQNDTFLQAQRSRQKNSIFGAEEKRKGQEEIIGNRAQAVTSISSNYAIKILKDKLYIGKIVNNMDKFISIVSNNFMVWIFGKKLKKSALNCILIFFICKKCNFK